MILAFALPGAAGGVAIVIWMLASIGIVIAWVGRRLA